MLKNNDSQLFLKKRKKNQAKEIQRVEERASEKFKENPNEKKNSVLSNINKSNRQNYIQAISIISGNF